MRPEGGRSYLIHSANNCPEERPQHSVTVGERTPTFFRVTTLFGVQNDQWINERGVWRVHWTREGMVCDWTAGSVEVS